MNDAMQLLSRAIVKRAVPLVFATAACGLSNECLAQGGDVASGGSPDLADLFVIGGLVLDRNGDSVPDFVNATLVMGAPPSDAERRAASEIAARLGFETMAMDLPVARGIEGGGIPIVIGRGGLAASNVALGVDPDGLEAGEGAVHVREIDGRRWVVVIGGDDAGLQAAARTLAGVLPHTKTLSSPHLNDVRSSLVDALEAAAGSADIRMPEVRVRFGSDGIERLVAELTVEDGDIDAVSAAVRSLAARSGPATDDRSLTDSTRFSFVGLNDVEVRVRSPSRAGPSIVVSARPAPPPPGPIPGRPGGGAKRSLDLSNLYTSEGLLGDGDGDLIPDRVDALLVPSASGTDRLPDLAGRLGLESTGLVVPLVVPSDQVEEPGSQPTMVLVGTDHSIIQSLADSGKLDVSQLRAGEGIVQFVPKAFGSKSAVVVTGGDDAGANRALQQLAETLPHVHARGKDRPTLDDVEHSLWSTLSGRSPAGQAAIGLYKLDRVIAQLREKDLASARVLVSVEKPDPGLEAMVRERARAFGADAVDVTVDDRDVQNAATLFDDSFDVPSEVDRFWSTFRDRVLPGVSRGVPIRVEARLSEPPEIRRRIAGEAKRMLVERGADPRETEVTVLSAFKQGYSWLYDEVRPRLEDADIGEMVIRFRKNVPPAEWPQQAMHTPVRWLHEIFPIDEILARELSVTPERIRFEMTTEGPTYEVRVTDGTGRLILSEAFEPRWVLRPYFDRFRDYEHVRVTTGWIEARSGDRELVNERIVTDPEWFWDYYQSTTLPRIYDYVMDRHEGKPRGSGADAPFFGELVVELEMSEPHYLLDLDKELIAPMDAMHEEIYFGTIEFFHLIGRNSRGQDLTYPGRIIPVMRPKGDGTPGRAAIRFTGFATSRPAVVVEYRERSGATGQVRLDIPRITMERPSARLAMVRVGQPGLTRLDLRVKVDTEADERDRLLMLAAKEQVDERMISAEQVAATLENVGAMRATGMYRSALAFADLGEIGIWAEWSHDEDPTSRRAVTLPANGTAEPVPDWTSLVPGDWKYTGNRIVQWDTPIPPGEGHRMLGQLASAFDEATVYQVGESYLGKAVWAMDLMPPVVATHWSHAKATTFKPTVVYSARQHANEVSSTSHVLRHAELLLTDPEQRKKLDRVNVVIHPFTNPDGAQLAYDLYRITPELILHAGYLGSLGMDATSGSGDDHPVYPEAPIRNRIWASWLPDIFLNPHGYPSHQVVQLFSEYTGLVRRGRVTERNWGFNKGWFMPGFGYVDDPQYPRHRDAAFAIRDYITRGINGNRDVFEMNQRNYDRYRRYGADFDPDVFRLPLVDSVLIQMPLKGSRGQTGGRGFNPKVTIWSGTTEAPDETAHGEWMKLVATAGLAWDQAILDYLYDGQHEVERSGSGFFGGVTLKMNRPRPPKSKDEKEDETQVSAAAIP